MKTIFYVLFFLTSLFSVSHAFCPAPLLTGNAYQDQMAQQAYHNCLNQERYQQQQLQMQEQQLQMQRQQLQMQQQQQNQGPNFGLIDPSIPWRGSTQQKGNSSR